MVSAKILLYKFLKAAILFFEVIMKKYCFVLAVFLTAACACFSQGYKYVEASSGLRVRDNASLSANKIGVVYDRMKVKVVELGPKVTIDGISSNWVKIVMPLESFKKKTSVTGWVFGGYLTDKLKPFSTAGWTDSDLTIYLTRFAWIYNGFRFMNFGANGKYEFGLMESSLGGDGTYSVSMKDKKIIAKVSYSDDSGEWVDVKTEVYEIDSILEDKLCLKYKGEMLELYPAIFSHDYFYSSLYTSNTSCEPSLYLKGYNALFYEWSRKYIDALSNKMEFNDVFYKNMKLMGIDLE